MWCSSRVKDAKLAKKKQSKAEKSSASFEQALAELEAVVHDLENGELGLAEALERYELGVKRLKQCQQLLEKAEQKIEVLTRVDASGRAVTRPYDEAQTGQKRDGNKAASRRDFDDDDDLNEAFESDSGDAARNDDNSDLDEDSDVSAADLPDQSDIDDFRGGREPGLF